MFVGRENELNALQALFEKPMPSLVTCLGRRVSTYSTHDAKEIKKLLAQLP